MRLLRDSIVIRPSADEDISKTASGFFIPVDKSFVEGVVVATGEFAGRALDGTPIESTIRIGDTVLYRRGTGENFAIGDDDKLKLMNEGSVVAVLELANVGE